MKHLPEKVYISKCYDEDRREIMPAKRESREDSDVKYIRSDIAEAMAKEFGQYCWNNMWTNKTLDELFTEFINQSK